jgi:hypothetical protein
MNKLTNKILNRYLPLGLAVLALVIGAVIYMVGSPSTPSAEAGWYSTGGTWGYRKQITIDHNKVSGTSTLVNFPMLFSVTDTDLKYTGSGGKVGNTDGTDILFTSSDGTTKLDHEIEKYASTTGETIMWVEIPTLSPTTDTTIYIYYGNAGASNQSNATGVWDSNYKGVWHLKEILTASGQIAYDSTTQSNLTATGTWVSGLQVPGQVDGSLDFSSTSLVSTIVPTASTTDVSMSAWIKWSGVIGSLQIIAHNGISGSNGYGLLIGNGCSIGSYIQVLTGGISCNVTGSSYTLPTGQWTHVAFTRNSSVGFKLYVNGVLRSSVSSGSVNVPTGGAGVGSDYQRLSQFNGLIDEVKISNIVRSDGWIATEYNNQNSPLTFYSYGTQGVNSRQNSSGASTPAIKNRGGVKFR